MNKLFKKFQFCTRCRLHEVRRQIVWGRGDMNGKLLFVGEGPGRSEDVLGIAFIGRAGKCQDELIEDAWRKTGIESKVPAYYMINMVGCHPTDEFDGDNREPKRDEVLTCLPRVRVLINYMNPITIILLGNTVKKFYKKLFPTAYQMVHPSHIARGGCIHHPKYRGIRRRLMEILEIHYESLQRGNSEEND